MNSVKKINKFVVKIILTLIVAFSVTKDLAGQEKWRKFDFHENLDLLRIESASDEVRKLFTYDSMKVRENPEKKYRFWTLESPNYFTTEQQSHVIRKNSVCDCIYQDNDSLSLFINSRNLSGYGFNLLIDKKRKRFKAQFYESFIKKTGKKGMIWFPEEKEKFDIEFYKIIKAKLDYSEIYWKSKLAIKGRLFLKVKMKRKKVELISEFICLKK